MSSYYHKFGINDVFHNRIKAHPQSEFFIWKSKVYFNKKSEESGSFASNATGTPVGYVSLYEMNVDRNSDHTGFIYPYLEKSSDRTKISTMTDSDFNTLEYAARVTGSYLMSASIGRQYFSAGLSGSSHLGLTGSALENTFNYYKKLSPHYAYSSSILSFDKASNVGCLLTIPSIFYGSSIKKGSIELNFYITGTLIGTLQDTRKNGELVQTAPEGSTGSGSVAGVALYNEGFIYLSGSWNIEPETYTLDGAAKAPRWVHFGDGAQHVSSSADASASFGVAFSGTNYVPSITMLAHAKKGELNHSNNFSYIKHGQTSLLSPYTGSTAYFERDLDIKNIVSSSYVDPTGSFQKTTYISKIGIYDDDKNLIAIASLAKPVKKTEERDLTFKLKLDI